PGAGVAVRIDRRGAPAPPALRARRAFGEAPDGRLEGRAPVVHEPLRDPRLVPELARPPAQAPAGQASEAVRPPVAPAPHRGPGGPADRDVAGGGGGEGVNVGLWLYLAFVATLPLVRPELKLQDLPALQISDLFLGAAYVVWGARLLSRRARLPPAPWLA